MLPAKGAENQPAVELTQVRHVGFLLHHGRVAELADAQDSGSCVRKDVRVQVPPRPPAFSPLGFSWLVISPTRNVGCK